MKIHRPTIQGIKNHLKKQKAAYAVGGVAALVAVALHLQHKEIHQLEGMVLDVLDNPDDYKDLKD